MKTEQSSNNVLEHIDGMVKRYVNDPKGLKRLLVNISVQSFEQMIAFKRERTFVYILTGLLAIELLKG